MFASARSAFATHALRISLCVLIVSMFATGCATERFKTDARVDTTYDFEGVKSFAFDVKREKVASSDNGKIIETALREGLVARGFEEVDKGEADVLISFDIGVFARGGMSGALQRTRQHGDITIWVYDASSGENIWYGWAETALRPGDQPEPTIRAAVEAIFGERVKRIPKSE